MSEWFDLCRGLRRIARHNSRCENGWLISFYSWHRGLSVWLCSLCSARGSHRLLAVTSLSPARRHGAHLSAGPGSSHPGHPAPKRHTGPAGGPRQCTGVTWPGLRPAQWGSFSGRLEPGRAPGGRELIGLSLAKLPPSRLLGQAGQARPWSLSITRSPDPISSNL